MRVLVFLLFPAIELYLLVKVGGIIGALNMVLWVFVSALIGLWAVRTQGQGAMLKARADLAEGRVPQDSFLEGLLLFIGGILLILPGLLTDAVGLVLLVPQARALAAPALARFFSARQSAGGGASRVVFFRSVNFDSGSFSGGENTRFQYGPEHEADPREPRQATIIESTAIEVESDGASAPGERQPDHPGGKE